VVVKETSVARAGSGLADIADGNFPPPFRIEQIPIGLKLLHVDQFGVVVNRTVGRRADVVENKLSFRIGVLVPLQIPFRLIRNLRKEQRRLDRIERFGDMELLIVGIGSRTRNVGEKFLRAPFGEQPRPELIAAAGYRDNFDLRQFLLKVGLCGKCHRD